MEETLNLKEAAHKLGVSSEMLRRLVAEGGVPHLRIGKRIIFNAMALEQWVREEAWRSVKSRHAILYCTCGSTDLLYMPAVKGESAMASCRECNNLLPLMGFSLGMAFLDYQEAKRASMFAEGSRGVWPGQGKQAPPEEEDDEVDPCSDIC